MKQLISILFVIAAVINLAPVSGALSAGQLITLYQIGNLGPDLELLMRHRALLFAIVGSLILAAAFVPHLRVAATAAGLVSMVSFVVLVFTTGNNNPALLRIAWVDIGATVTLLLAFGLHLAGRGSPADE